MLLGMATVSSNLAAFKRVYGVTNGKGGCWLWSGSLDGGGYGRLRVDGKDSQAHRFALMLAGVEIPVSAEVGHTCGVRHCVNPQHLELTTRATNPARRRHGPLLDEFGRVERSR